MIIKDFEENYNINTTYLLSGHSLGGIIALDGFLKCYEITNKVDKLVFNSSPFLGGYNKENKETN